jgi:hypothetical protein
MHPKQSANGKYLKQKLSLEWPRKNRVNVVELSGQRGKQKEISSQK